MTLLAAEASGVANAVVETTAGAIGLAWALPVIPLVGFLLVLAATKSLRDRAATIGIVAAGLSFALAIAVAVQVIGDPATYVRPMPTWIEAGPFVITFDLLVDQLTTVMLLVVTGVGFLIHLYSLGYMKGDPRFSRFFAYLNLFLASMLILVLGANLLTLFLGWELVGLSSYLLIGFWFERASYASAAKKAFITNRVGDVSFMIGMFLTFATVGTLDILGVIDQAEAIASGTAFALVLLYLGGAVAKSAQIPLYVWLPDAMAGPTPVSALIHAATMVTAGVYLLVRISPVLIGSVPAMEVIAWIGALTALMAALIAVRQDDIKKVLAYSTVSQLGFMVLAIGVGAFAESIFHLVTHAFFKGLLFLVAGSVMHAMADEGDIWKMGGLRKKMPVTFVTAAIGTAAIAGVPPLSGFFSKDHILNEAYFNGYGPIWMIGLAAAILTAFYMTRWFVLIFLGKPRWAPSVSPHESPTSMTVPLVILGALSLLGGALNIQHVGPLYRFLEPVVASTEGLGYEPYGPYQEGLLISLAIVAAVIGIAIAVWLYLVRDLPLGRDSEPIRGPVAEVMERGFFVDELYEAITTGFGGAVARGLAWFDVRVVDGIVNGAGAVSVYIGRASRRLQSGLVRGYVAATVAGAVIVIAVLMVQVR